MKKLLVCLLATLLLLGAGCTATQVPTQTETPTTEVTEPQPPRFLDDNGDGNVIWYAVGDSITQGYYSQLDEAGKGVLKFDANQVWSKLLAEKTGWTLNNHAVGGSGFVHKATVLDKLSGRDHIDGIDFSQAELVTIAFGINDWKGNQKLGTMEDDVTTGGTIYSNMRYIIEKIQKDNPDAEIVVIAPMNSSRYGLAEKGWSLGYKFSKSKTLQNVYDVMEDVCKHYKLPMIDLTHNEEINGDIQNWFPDGVHPSLEKHVRLTEILEEELKKVLPAE